MINCQEWAFKYIQGSFKYIQGSVSQSALGTRSWNLLDKPMLDCHHLTCVILTIHYLDLSSGPHSTPLFLPPSCLLWLAGAPHTCCLSCCETSQVSPFSHSCHPMFDDQSRLLCHHQSNIRRPHPVRFAPSLTHLDRCVQRRRPGLEYFVEHHQPSGSLVVLTNHLPEENGIGGGHCRQNGIMSAGATSASGSSGQIPTSSTSSTSSSSSTSSFGLISFNKSPS